MLPPPAKMLELAVGGEFSLKGSFVFEASARTNAFLLRGNSRSAAESNRAEDARTSLPSESAPAAWRQPQEAKRLPGRHAIGM